MFIRAPKEFWKGAIYLIAGAVGWIVGREYSFGSAARMGPGFFPTFVSVLLVLFGAVSIARSFLVTGEAIGRIPWRALALVVGSSVAFACLLRPFGFIVAATLLLLMSAAASAHFRLEWKSVASLVALVTVSALVFVEALGLPMPLIGQSIKLALPIGHGG